MGGKREGDLLLGLDGREVGADDLGGGIGFGLEMPLAG